MGRGASSQDGSEVPETAGRSLPSHAPAEHQAVTGTGVPAHLAFAFRFPLERRLHAPARPQAHAVAPVPGQSEAPVGRL